MTRGAFGQLGTWNLLVRMALLAMIVVLLDRAAARVVTERLGPDAGRHAWWLIGDDVGFEYVRNTGAAFGLFRGNPELLGAVSILVAIGFVWLILNELPRGIWAVLSGGLLVGGAASNLIGRIHDGFVTDYVAVGPWPRFNLADSAISIGVAIFVVSMLFGVTPNHGGNGSVSGHPHQDVDRKGGWQRE